MTIYFASQIVSDSIESPENSTFLNGLGSFSSLFTRVAVADANYNAASPNVAKNSIFGYTSITATRTVTLPSAATPGQLVAVVDETGSCSASISISIVRNSTDTINGATTYTLNSAYAYVLLLSNGVGRWIVIGTPRNMSIVSGTASSATFKGAAASTYNCGGGCSWTCSTTCTGGCNNSCSGQCSNGCTTGCQTSCSTTCTGNCNTACSYTCTGGCINGCSGTCTGVNI